MVVLLVGVLGLALGWGSSTTRSVGSETPEGFLATLVHAERVGDRAFLFVRLDGAVLARYGTAQCQDAVAGLVDPSAALRLVSVSGPVSYRYTSGGRTVVVPNTYALRVTGRLDQQTGTRDLHLALVGGQFRIFISCGQPLPGAP